MLTTASRKMSSEMTPEEKGEIINSFRQYHMPFLTFNNIPLSDFNVKAVFTHNYKKVVGIFPNEFRKKNGFYFEMIDTYLQPLDADRKLYRVVPRENYENVYEMTKKGTFAVPLDELEEVVLPIMDQAAPEYVFKTFMDDTDEHYAKMTIRDFAAIVQWKPVSTKDWINKMIINTK